MEVTSIGIDLAKEVFAVRGFKVVRYSVSDGSCAAYYPETNQLLPLNLFDPLSGTPSAKGVPVILTPSQTSPLSK